MLTFSETSWRVAALYPGRVCPWSCRCLSPAHLAGLRRAARACLREVASQAAYDLVLTLNQVATNAILYGSRGGQPIEWWPTSTTT